jgi:hypothetical protein
VEHAVPQAVLPIDALPRTPTGALDVAALPLPVLGGVERGGKGGRRHGPARSVSTGAVLLATTAACGLVALLLTTVVWPGATDLSAVPQPWATAFLGLYVAECLAFGLGIGFLLFGRPLLADQGRAPALSGLAHLALAWLLIAWWPQDNLYRLTARTDWQAQAALAYGFNVTMMIAAAILVAFAVSGRREP